jgi:hypothetical protein
MSSLRWSKFSTLPLGHHFLRVQDHSVLQAENNELTSDAFEGMCALGIESHRKVALFDALMSVGVDPNLFSLPLRPRIWKRMLLG